MRHADEMEVTEEKRLAPCQNNAFLSDSSQNTVCFGVLILKIEVSQQITQNYF